MMSLGTLLIPPLPSNYIVWQMTLSRRRRRATGRPDVAQVLAEKMPVRVQ